MHLSTYLQLSVEYEFLRLRHTTKLICLINGDPDDSLNLQWRPFEWDRAQKAPERRAVCTPHFTYSAQQASAGVNFVAAAAAVTVGYGVPHGPLARRRQQQPPSFYWPVGIVVPLRLHNESLGASAPQSRL